MASSSTDGSDPTGTPARPSTATPTEQWLARISDQLDSLLEQTTPKPKPVRKATGKRTEVRGT